MFVTRLTDRTGDVHGSQMAARSAAVSVIDTTTLPVTDNARLQHAIAEIDQSFMFVGITEFYLESL